MVELTYQPCHSQDEFIKAFKNASLEKENDFVEGLVYSHDSAVIMTGKMVPYSSMLSHPTRFNPIGLWWKPWFYQHVESYLNAKPDSDRVEYIPLRDYYHRHTRAIFWVSSSLFFSYFLGIKRHYSLCRSLAL